MCTKLHIAAFIILVLAGCAPEDPDRLLGGGPTLPGPIAPTEPPAQLPVAPPPTASPTCGGKPFVGFDGHDLVADRVVANAGVDRGRFKPYDALPAEYKRVLGSTPASLAGAADTFGKAEARWYDEPLAGGVVLQTAYAVAFDGCLTYTQTPAEFAVSPTVATAATQCATMARAFWSHTASPAQISACVDVAVSGTAGETNARRRWAYVCASVLSAAGFLTY